MTIGAQRSRVAAAPPPYTAGVTFRDRLLASLQAVQPVLDVPEVLIGGSQVPNLLEPAAASTLVVSQDVDVVVPVGRHQQVKAALTEIQGYTASEAEASVWLPDSPDRLEINFIGVDHSLREAAESYVLEDERLPLLVFGLLSHLRPGPRLEVAGLSLPLPRPAGLLIEKLLTDRSGLKGERDLLVALGLLLVARPEDIDELTASFAALSSDEQRGVLSSLGLLSLLKPLPEMPDPTAARDQVDSLLRRLEGGR
ncbi:MAG TPA: hypothetical protein VN811_10185 [Thermoanaerobaculia bacterium]|nr:hypothetical protein [Thermoanaerobaculia bacterium]HXT51400.1 hypothetical protein [Thermoanaerobaculia bacterium]